MDNQWARLHRLYDPEDLLKDREWGGEKRRETTDGLHPRLTEHDFYRRIDDSDDKRDEENW